MIYMYHNKKNSYENFNLSTECTLGNDRWNHCNDSLITQQSSYSDDWWNEGQGCHGCPKVCKGKKLDGTDINNGLKPYGAICSQGDKCADDFQCCPIDSNGPGPCPCPCVCDDSDHCFQPRN